MDEANISITLRPQRPQRGARPRKQEMDEAKHTSLRRRLAPQAPTEFYKALRAPALRAPCSGAAAAAQPHRTHIRDRTVSPALRAPEKEKHTRAKGKSKLIAPEGAALEREFSGNKIFTVAAPHRREYLGAKHRSGERAGALTQTNLTKPKAAAEG
jgi:hypothetical protein